MATEMWTPSLREIAGVTEGAMNAAYDVLREETDETLQKMWALADPHDMFGALLRWQIGHVLLCRAEGKAQWFPKGVRDETVEGGSVEHVL